MSFILSLFTQILHIGLMLATAPTITGLIDWLRAELSGHSGPPVLLPWHDLIRLSRKTAMKPATVASWLVPATGLGATLAAAALVPSFTLAMALSPLADVLVVVSLLTIARVAEIMAALDAGAALPALAARDNTALAIVAEPALMLAMIALALMGGSFNLEQLINQQRDGPLLPATALAVVLAAFLALAFADIAKPADGLDQTFSGIELGMYRMTGWLRRLIWFDLLGGLFLPMGIATTEAGLLDWLSGLVCWGIKIVGSILILAWVQARLGLPRRGRTDLVAIAALLALLATVMVIASSGNA